MAPILLQWEEILDLCFCCVVSGAVLTPAAFCQKISNGILKSLIPSYTLTLDSANCFQRFSVHFQRRPSCCICSSLSVCCSWIFVGPQLLCQRMREVTDHLVKTIMARICSSSTCQCKKQFGSIWGHFLVAPIYFFYCIRLRARSHQLSFSLEKVAICLLKCGKIRHNKA